MTPFNEQPTLPPGVWATPWTEPHAARVIPVEPTPQPEPEYEQAPNSWLGMVAMVVVGVIFLTVIMYAADYSHYDAGCAGYDTCGY